MNTFRLGHISQLVHLFSFVERLEGEVTVINHVIQIIPYDINWDTISIELVPNIDKVLGAFVSPSALMIALTPKWVNRKAFDIPMVALYDGLRVGRPKEELNDDVPSDDVESH